MFGRGAALAVAAYALAVITHSRVRPAVTRLSVPSHKLNRVAGEQKMSNLFDRLKSGSAGHRARVNSDGRLLFQPLAPTNVLWRRFSLTPRLH
jgi:hypothetical protein